MRNIILFVFFFSISFVYSQKTNGSFFYGKKKIIQSLETNNKKLDSLNTNSTDTIINLKKDITFLNQKVKTQNAIIDKNSEILKCQKIGEQFWMKQNLAVLTLNNGVKIKEAKTTQEWDESFKKGTPAYCFHKNDSLKQNGVIYNIHALNSGLLAPKGYKIPSKHDVEELIESFHSLKDSASFFLKSDDQKTWNKKGLDLFDMNIKPYGFRLSDGVDWYSGDKVYYFCESTINEDQLLELYVFSEFSNKIYFLTRNKESAKENNGFYVRCIIDK